MSIRYTLIALLLLLRCTASAQFPDIEWIIPQQSYVSELALSKDGRFAATAGWSDVKIWDVSTRELLRIFPISYQSAAVAFGPENALLALAESRPFRFRLYDVEARRFLVDITDTSLSASGSITCSPTGTMLATADFDSVRLWSATDGSRIRTMAGRVGKRNSVQFSADGAWLYAGGVYGVEMWEVSSGRHFYPLLDLDTVTGLAVSPDGRTAAVQIRRSWEDPDPVRLWDLMTGDSIRTLPVSNIDGMLHFSADGTRLMTNAERPMTNSRGLQLWNVATGALEWSVTGRRADLFTVSASGSRVLIGNEYGDIEIRDGVTGDSLGRLTPYRMLWGHLRFSPAGDRVAVGNYGFDPVSGRDVSGIGLLDAATGAFVAPHRIDAGSPWDNYDFHFSPDGLYMAGIWGNGIRLADLSTGDSIRTMRIPGIQRIGPSLSWSADGRLIAGSGDTLGRVHVWRFDGELDRTLPTESIYNGVVRFSPDGRWLAALGERSYSDRGPRLSIWNTTTWERRTIDVGIDSSYYPVGFLEFFPDSRMVAIGGHRSVVGLWDIVSGNRVGELPHDAAVRDIAITRDGRYLVAAVMDGTLRVWDLLSRTIVHTYTDYPLAQTRVEISPDSKRIVSMAEDRTLIMWRALDRMSSVRSESSSRQKTVSMRVEPNPAEGSRATLRFDRAIASEGHIAIIDMVGSIRRQMTIRPLQSTIELDLRDLENGIYLLRASRGEEMSSERLVVIR